jgi:hypothetical protein
MSHACAQGVVGDEEHTPLNLSARDGLGDVVQETDDAKPIGPLLADLRADPAFHELPLHASDNLEYVLEGVEMVVRALSLVPGELKLRYLAEQSFYVERVFQRSVERHVYRL